MDTELESYLRAPRTHDARALRRRRPVLDLFEDLTRPLCIDLFCGQGGSAMGYWRAGFRIIGVDKDPQRYYPFPFVRADALQYLQRGLPPEAAVVTASPPCQRYSSTAYLMQRTRGYNKHPDLVGVVRDHLVETGLPYVIENVPGAPMRDPIMLCGAMFRLRTYRHRLFESSLALTAPPHPTHMKPVGKMGRPTQPWEMVDAVGNFSDVEQGREALGIDWMTRSGLTQAIPPSYTLHVGFQIMAHLRGEEVPHPTRRPIQATIADATRRSHGGSPATDPRVPDER